MIFLNLTSLTIKSFLTNNFSPLLPGLARKTTDLSRHNLPRAVKTAGEKTINALRVAKLLLGFAFLFFLLGLGGCQSATAKRNAQNQAIAVPGRSGTMAINSQTNPALVNSKTYNTTSNTTTSTKKGAQQQPTAPPPFSWPPGFDRVAMLPIYTRIPTGGATNDLDEIFRAELSKALPLEVIHVSRTDMLAAIGEDQIASTAIIPQKLIQFLQQKYAVQGVIFTDMPVYRPYRPVNIGIRCKLVKIPSMEIMWAADGILDSAEPGIAASAVEYARGNLKGPGKGAPELILQSPRRYAAFVAYGLYRTMPGVYQPE